MKQILIPLGGLGLAILLLTAAVVFGGLYNVSARNGHWPGVAWVLHSAFESSVRLRAATDSSVPELTAERAILGAGHYDTACRFCHGVPGQARTATAQAMVPQPPPIAEAVSRWKPSELGWIVREGIKMTGMPAWPATRDDEVWSLVSFLIRVPDMQEAKYRQMLARPNNVRSTALAFCATCHGEEGHSQNSFIPRLDIQHRAYLEEALSLYRNGTRQSGFMHHAATAVAESELAELAEHYAGIAPTGSGWQVDTLLAERGRELAFARSGNNDVPACRACHGPWPDSLRSEFPSLAGQSPDFLATQLELWREDGRGGGARHELMAESSRYLTDQDISALVAYYAGLAPARLGEVSDPQIDDERQVAR